MFHTTCHMVPTRPGSQAGGGIPPQLPSPTPALVAIKIGGSLFSDKREARTVDVVALDQYAAAIAALCEIAPGRVVLISGGGAFGHDAVRFLDPVDSDAVLPLTEAMFALKWLWTEALRSHGCRAIPLQVAGFASRDEQELRVDGEVLRRLLDASALPVLSGDVIIGNDGGLEVLGSDRVPELLLKLDAGPVRVALLTDVPGILLDGPGGSEVLREIDPDLPQTAAAAIWETPAWDTSRSMSGKLDAALALAQHGAECLIMEGRPKIEFLRRLVEPCDAWPPSASYTRIDRSTASLAPSG
jgi:isopentenyl phosphate kinase